MKITYNNKEYTVHLLYKIESPNGKNWWLWDCQLEDNEGNTIMGTIEGDDYSCAPETFEAEEV